MKKINDRITLGIVAGGIGSIFGLLLDQIFFSTGKSKRSWPTTAAGVWLSSRKEAESSFGQLLGIFMTIGLCMLGAFQFINLLCKYGRDKIVLKGLFFGMTFSSIIHASIGGVLNQKLKPTNAVSNFSYLLSGSLFGMVTALTAAKLGHDSLFDVQPQNDQVEPTEQTTEELKLHKPLAAK